MSDEERSDSLQSVEIPNEMYQQAIFNNNGPLTQMNTSAVSDLHQLEVMTGMSQQTLNDLSAPYLRILEQPKQRGFRFRYDCEGPSHGGLPGQNNQKSKRTYPSVEIVNYTGLARIVVTLVTNEEIPKPHAHSIVGKHCKDGACTVQVGPSDMTASFPNLGILHVTRKKVETVLKERLRDQQKLYRTVLDNKGCSQYVTDSDEQLSKKAQEMSKAMDLSVVRLCFQAYLPDATSHFIQPLAPVISVPIYDSKAPGATTLKICRMDKSSGCVTGNEEVYLLCDKVQKDDVQVRFFEMNNNGEITWEANGEFGPTDVHRQFAIVFKTPPYKDCKIEKPVYVQVQLQRRSDREVSDPKPFIYHPQVPDIESILRKRKKGIPTFQDNFFDGGSGGKGRFGGSGGGGSGYQFTEDRPTHFNFGAGSGGGGPSNSLNMNREQQHLVMMKSYQEQQQQQQQQKQQQLNRQTITLQSRGISKACKQVVIPSGFVESVQDSQPAVVPRVGLNMDQEDDSDLEVDSCPIGKGENEKDRASSLLLLKKKEPRELFQSMVNSVDKVKNVTDTSMQTDDISLDYDSMVWRLAERTSHALHDFAITADIKMILAVQRNLIAVDDENGDTPLHLAIIHKQHDVVVSLLHVITSIPKQNIINQINKLHQTPLHLAVMTQQSDIVELLLRSGADPNTMDHSGNMPLHLAANNGSINCTQHLVQRPRQSVNKSRVTIQPIQADLNASNLDGFTAAHISVNRCDLKNLKVLVKNGADVNIPDGKSGRTPLHYAVEQENFALLSYLITDADCDIHLQTFAGDTALHLASSLDYMAVAAVLITAGADPYIESYDTSDETIEEGDNNLDKSGMEYKQEIPEEEVKEVCGKTSMDLAQTERMVDILKGDPYIASNLHSLDTRCSSGLESKPQKSGMYPQFSSDAGYQSTSSTSSVFLSGDLNRLNSLVRRKLESLLDEVNPHKDWVSLADRLGLGNMINQLKQFDSPTSILLDQYEAMDGTISELKTVLKSLNRDDALNVIEELNMPSKKGTLCVGTNHVSQVDSGLASSLQSMHITSMSTSTPCGKSVQSSYRDIQCK